MHTTHSENKTKRNHQAPAPFNWPIVSFLLFMTGIPAIPAFFLIAIVLMGPGAIEGVSNALNQLHFDMPLAVVVHGGSGILYFLSMPFQFSPRLRRRGAKWHKRGGYVALVSGCMMALSGIWMHHVLLPDDLGARYLSLWVVAIGMCGAFTFALQRIIAGDVQSHRIWMCRAVAISLAVVTPVLIEIPVYLIFTQFDGVMINASKIMHDYGRLVGLVMNLVVLQWWLTRSRNQRDNEPLHQAASA